MTKQLLIACSVLLLGSSAYASVDPAPKTMHPSWDADKDGVNDCEKDGTCDDSVDYSLPRGTDVVSYTENFYKAVNREWLATHEIDPKSGKVSNFDFIVDNVNQQLKSIIDRLDKADKLTADEQKIIDLYRSYVNVEYRNKLGITPLTKGMKTIQSAKTHADIAKLFAELSKIGVSTPLSVQPTIDKKDSTKYILSAMQGRLKLTKETYLEKSKSNDEKIKYYKEYLNDMMVLAKLNNVSKRVDDIFKLETELAKIQWGVVQLKESAKTYNVADFKKLDTLLSNLNMNQYLEIHGMKKDIPFAIEQEEYLKALNELFAKTDVELWKKYLEMNYIRAFGQLTISEFADVDFEYDKNLGLATQRKEKWEEGIGVVNLMTGMLFGKLYIKEYFDEKSKAKTQEIIEAIMDQYKISIADSTLFSQATKERALKKVNSMEFNIGYPDKWQDYSALTIDKTDLIGNFSRISAYNNARSIDKLDKPVDRTEWVMTPQTVNAFYMPPYNKFIILAAILNKPFFDINASDAQNYGAMGMVIAHEIGHGFDDTGSRYDYEGNLVDWWEKEDRVKYATRAKMLISQADHFEYLPGAYLNGQLEIGEIIGDLNGVTIALAAYEKVIKAKGLDRKASLKAFFIQLAKVWRNKTEPHLLEKTMHTDSHPVSEFRVNGVLKNVDTFHEIFETKKGDKMYMAPEKRVKLW